MDAVKTGGLIAQVRKEKQLTQRDLAEQLHVSVQAVSKWERGLSCPDIGLLEPLAEALDLTVTELLSGQRGEEPGEAAVRDSLRFGLAQLGPKIRRWRWLFLLAAALLLALLLGLGYVWVRDNTQLLPQRETVVAPMDITNREQVMVKVLSNGKSELHLYDVVLADGLSGWTFQMELWAGGRMEQSWVLDKEDRGSWDGAWTYPRHQLLALGLEPEYNGEFGGTGSLKYTLCFGSLSHAGFIEKIPHLTGGMIVHHPLKERSTLDPEEGVPLLVWSVQGSDRAYHQWGTSVFVEETAFLVFKMYCK